MRLALFAGVASLAACGGDTASSLPPDVGVVEVVIDGDTVDIDIGGRQERVRLIGIDTPELHTDATVRRMHGSRSPRVHVVGVAGRDRGATRT